MKVGRVCDWLQQPNETKQFQNIKLKPMQIAILQCNKYHDVIVNLPTGFGKSLLFQYPAYTLLNTTIIVFVPLRALLWDCLKEAKLLNIFAVQLCQNFLVKYKSDHQLPKLLFLTPQKLFMNAQVRHFVQQLHSLRKISKFVIDQVHCVSEWGSDFRPHYLQLTHLKLLFPGINILAMSATITPESRQDLIQCLKIHGCYYFQASFNRANLHYIINNIQKNTIYDKIHYFLISYKMTKQFGIIYCQTISNAEQLYKLLSKNGINCGLFHSKISLKKRQNLFECFMNGTIKIMVATICFGMGINKKDIRFVIHAGISKSFQTYYQQSGRAGRDGYKAYCVLFSYASDSRALIYLTQKSKLSYKLKKRSLYKIQQMKKFIKKQQCRKSNLFRHLGENFTPQQCNYSCDYCFNNRNQQNLKKKELNYTNKALNIIKQLQNQKSHFTRKQLLDHLSGKTKSSKVYNHINQALKGYLRDEKMMIRQILIDKLIDKQLIVRYYPRVKPKRKGFFNVAQYYTVCKKQFQKNTTIILEIAEQSKTLRKQSQQQYKFNNYLNNKFEKQGQKYEQEQDHNKDIKVQEQIKESQILYLNDEHLLYLQQLLNGVDNLENEKVHKFQEKQFIPHQQFIQQDYDQIINDEINFKKISQNEQRQKNQEIFDIFQHNQYQNAYYIFNKPIVSIQKNSINRNNMRCSLQEIPQKKQDEIIKRKSYQKIYDLL